MVARPTVYPGMYFVHWGTIACPASPCALSWNQRSAMLMSPALSTPNAETPSRRIPSRWPPGSAKRHAITAFRLSAFNATIAAA
eukprot:3862364-Prymnesium_polylepis.1